MPQLHLYVSKEIAAEVKRRADRRGLSTSRYLAELVRSEVSDDWPAGFFEEVVGGWHGEPLTRPPQLPLEEREVISSPLEVREGLAPSRDERAGMSPRDVASSDTDGS